MAPLITLRDVSKSYGTQTLFRRISFSIQDKEQVALTGPNGAGKSTLLKILMGQETPDEGLVTKKTGLRMALCSQMPTFPSMALDEFLQKQCPLSNPSEQQARVNAMLGKAHFPDFHQNAATLSGGWKKRLDLIRALLCDPDVLLLDEPTNHLDLEGIIWLENFLARERRAMLIVSHDRAFLKKIGSTFIELNPAFPEGIFLCHGDMETFLARKEEFLQNQKRQMHNLQSEVREEMAWLKKSPKARTTKSRARVEKAHALINELSDLRVRNTIKKAHIAFTASERETRRLLTAKNLCKAMNGKILFQGLDIVLSPHSVLGVVGKNGSGKSCLLKVLSKELAPDAGTIKYADDLRLVTFDQHREQIPPDISLKEALCPHGDTVNYRGEPIHVHGWAKRFLFPQDRLSMPVKCLSGGERARILIAKLMLKAADILFLDEPTNDLDIPTLEMMESNLKAFPGAVVIISHDRYLMSRLCTQILDLGQEGRHAYFADYQQWEAHTSSIVKKEAPKPAYLKTSVKKAPPLTYHERKELQEIENQIQMAEGEVARLEKELQMPSIASDVKKTQIYYHLLHQEQNKVDALYLRWEYLEKKNQG